MPWSYEAVIEENQDLKEFFKCDDPLVLARKVTEFNPHYTQVIFDEENWPIGIDGVSPLLLAAQQGSSLHIYHCLNEFKKQWLKAILTNNEEDNEFFKYQARQLEHYPNVYQELHELLALDALMSNASSFMPDIEDEAPIFTDIEHIYKEHPKLADFFSQTPNKNTLARLEPRYLIAWRNVNKNNYNIERLDVFSIALLIGQFNHALFIAKQKSFEDTQRLTKYQSKFSDTSSEKECIQILKALRAKHFNPGSSGFTGLDITSPKKSPKQALKFFEEKEAPQTITPQTSLTTDYSPPRGTPGPRR